MSLREKMNNNPAFTTGGAVVVLLLCLFLIYCQFNKGGGGSGKLIYFDLAASSVKLVDIKVGEMPVSPLTGTEAYQATVLSCGECSEIKDGMSVDDLKSKGMFIGWLQRQNANPSQQPQPMEMFDQSMEVRSLETDKWFPIDSTQGSMLQRKSMEQCPDGRANPCPVKPRKK